MYTPEEPIDCTQRMYMCVYHVYKDTEGREERAKERRRERVKYLKRHAFRGTYITDVTRALG
jgi:hypothetical protein